MKLPNGYGSVFKLSGNRRKPWAVRVTASRTVDAAGRDHIKYRYLSYHKTQNEALTALARYNEHPYNLEATRVTFRDVYEMWSAEKFHKISKSNVNGYRAAYEAICSSLNPMKFCDIRKSHLQNAVDTCGKNYPTLMKVKSLFSQLYKYAMENDLCMKNYSVYVDIAQYKDRNPDTIQRKPFTTEEIKRLQALADTGNDAASIVMMLIYTGVRISELLELKKQDVNMDQKWFDVTHSKTPAGVRKVPIADRITKYFQRWMQKSPCEYLLCNQDGQHLTYDKFRLEYWMTTMDQLSMNHTIHDTRHTCVTLLNNAGTPDKLIKRIVGHKGRDVTDCVYTHYHISQMLEAINKI